MGQISPRDQLISNSAFINCSVTVINSGVIVTDVLLLCDAPPTGPSPSSSCADVIMFFGNYSSLFWLWCFAFLLLQVLLNARLPQWPRLESPPDQWDRRSLAREAVAYSPRTNHNAACLNRIKTYFWPVMLSVIDPLLPDVHTCVNVSEDACVGCWCGNVHRLSEFQCF